MSQTQLGDWNKGISCDPVVRTLRFHRRGHKFDPWSGTETLHVPWHGQKKKLWLIILYTLISVMEKWFQLGKCKCNYHIQLSTNKLEITTQKLTTFFWCLKAILGILIFCFTFNFNFRTWNGADYTSSGHFAKCGESISFPKSPEAGLWFRGTFCQTDKRGLSPCSTPQGTLVGKRSAKSSWNWDRNV